MGYQESWFYMEPQRKFDKLIRAYERAESAGYYRVAGAEPCSVAILKQPFGDVPAGSKVLWVCRFCVNTIYRSPCCVAVRYAIFSCLILWSITWREAISRRMSSSSMPDSIISTIQ